jgi:hypothetical protein
MNKLDEMPPESATADRSSPPSPRPAQDDPRVIQALEEYIAALQEGRRPVRAEFLARRPEITEALAECLEGLEFIYGAAPRLQQSVHGEPPAQADVHPEGPLGDFRIVREVGRGGMGVVYEAVQLSLGRRVALKVLPFAAALDAKHLQRFKNEAQAAAHLIHQNIVPVYYVGCERGVHFYAMQFIDGQTLAALIRDLRQPAGAGDRGSRIEDRGSQKDITTENGPLDERTRRSGLRSAILNPPSFARLPN